MEDKALYPSFWFVFLFVFLVKDSVEFDSCLLSILSILMGAIVVAAFLSTENKSNYYNV